MFRFLMLAIAVAFVSTSADAADKKDSGKAAGILIEKKNDIIKIKVDGDDEPTEFSLGTDKKVTDAMKGIFDACRVSLTYKKVGDAKQVTTIKRQIIKAQGTITGKVVKVYNDFWVEVKPKTGLADAFAPGGAFFKNKASMDLLKGLQPGDSVTITYGTDFERHRIATLKKNK
ncbi:MAG TPA: hypothetical protein VN641_12295 [Urbifossiella sp.]|jgi:hypothetical protein|nr:hypothetical protein [Urbifossiella sp.]